MVCQLVLCSFALFELRKLVYLLLEVAEPVAPVATVNATFSEQIEQQGLVGSLSTYMADGCLVMCVANPQLESSGLCDMFCQQVVAPIDVNSAREASCKHKTTAAAAELSPMAMMRFRNVMVQMVRHGMGFMTGVCGVYCFHCASLSWCDIKTSSRYVVRGWLLVFTAPLLISLVPWYIVFGFSDTYHGEGRGVVEFMSGAAEGFNYKMEMGFATYLSTYGIGVAASKSALKALLQLKLLVPLSSMLTLFFAALPVLNVILTWPVFAFVGTIVSSKTVWAFLLAFALRPFAFTLFSPMLDTAHSIVQVHRVLEHLSSVQMAFLAMAICCLLFDVLSNIVDVLLRATRFDTVFINALYANVNVLAATAFAVHLEGLQSMLVSVLVTFFVTKLALVDQALDRAFFLWEHDGYLQDDREMHDLAYLYCSSLYEIRCRSPALLSSCGTLISASKRIEWVHRLDKYATAFAMVDINRDRSIENVELANLLARLCADGGTAAGTRCQCLQCSSWAVENTALMCMSVNWKDFERKFAAVDANSNGDLDFGESVQLAEDRPLNPREVRDTVSLMDLKHTTLGQAHIASSNNAGGHRECSCYDCSLRRMAGFWWHVGANRAVNLVLTKQGDGWAGGLYVATVLRGSELGTRTGAGGRKTLNMRESTMQAAAAEIRTKKKILSSMIGEGEDATSTAKACFISKGFGLSGEHQGEAAWQKVSSWVDERELLSAEALSTSCMFEGKLADRRNTAEAWVEAKVFHIHLSERDTQAMDELGCKCEWGYIPSLQEIPSGRMFREGTRDDPRSLFVSQFAIPTHADLVLKARTLVPADGAGDDGGMQMTRTSSMNTLSRTSNKSNTTTTPEAEALATLSTEELEAELARRALARLK